MAQLIIFRHGESLWNLENRFTGWADVALTEKGILEAKEAGEKLKKFKLDKGYASELKRAQQTLLIALEASGQENIPVVFTKALNERNYGDLQGLNKAETIEKYGEELVNKWRRSFDVPPPNGESLKDTANRVIPYLKQNIMPELRKDKNVVVVTHGNTMRALTMYLENIPSDEITKLEFKTGEMRAYKFDGNLNIAGISNF
jgi:2,3-bisphosphoglycerate-dependent phosphoglycerate mutase